MKKQIIGIIEENRKVTLDLMQEIDTIKAIAARACAVYRRGGKLVFLGNGGSAADAQHLATELVCRFMKNRRSLPAIALTTNTSLITATGNDFSFDNVFSRQIESLVSSKDMVVGISTSGSSPNVLKAIREARRKKAFTVGFSSSKDTKLWRITDACIRVRSDNTARIQEGHILVGHILCGLIEETLF